MAIYTTTQLALEHEEIMKTQNVLISIYTNASGFLWNLMMVDSGTDLGWSEFTGDCKLSGAFTTYNKAFEDAILLIKKTPLKEFEKVRVVKSLHWGQYADYIRIQKD
jgi:hypothetical protein